MQLTLTFSKKSGNQTNTQIPTIIGIPRALPVVILTTHAAFRVYHKGLV